MKRLVSCPCPLSSKNDNNVSYSSGRVLFGRTEVHQVAEKRRRKIEEFCQVKKNSNPLLISIKESMCPPRLLAFPVGKSQGGFLTTTGGLHVVTSHHTTAIVLLIGHLCISIFGMKKRFLVLVIVDVQISQGGKDVAIWNLSFDSNDYCCYCVIVVVVVVVVVNRK